MREVEEWAKKWTASVLENKVPGMFSPDERRKFFLKPKPEDIYLKISPCVDSVTVDPFKDSSNINYLYLVAGLVSAGMPILLKLMNKAFKH
jgi:hypothetical protein